MTHVASPTPILVYQLGKVGSTSVHSSLVAWGGRPCHHLHVLNPVHYVPWLAEAEPGGDTHQKLSLGKRLYEEVVSHGLPMDVVTLVRDPVARNISDFFQNFAMYMGADPLARRASQAEMEAAFFRDHLRRVPLEWFDIELKPVLGIDVYAQSFPHAQGWQRLACGPRRVLILRAELDDAVKAAVLGEFLDIPGFTLTRDNEGEQKEYRDLYRAFREDIRFPAWYLEEMYGSRFARHFYSAAEITRFRRRWRPREGEALGRSVTGTFPATSTPLTRGDVGVGPTRPGHGNAHCLAKV